MKNRNFRKRRLIIPLVFVAALLIGGEVYAFVAPTAITNDVSSSFASDNSPAKEAEGMNAVPKGATVTFYAGDDAMTTAAIKPNSDGGYKNLPQAKKDGYAFVGWYTERAGGTMVSDTRTADLRDGDTLYARWRKESTGVDQSVRGLSVLMYHWFYDLESGDERPATLQGNWMEASQFESEMLCLKNAGWYFPSWDEVYAYVRGETDLPDRSIVITVDDGRQSFYEYAVPVFEKLEIRGTGFIIANKLSKAKAKKYASEFVSLQSHTWNMHDGSGGKSLLQTLPFEQAVADLTSASAILGASDALAYPYGYYDDAAVSACRAAGVRMAFGTSGGKVYPGMDPLRLPRIRISSGQSAEAFARAYG
ncbi:MAG: polysaccharide deacetylase family protein, partial [Clostridiales Family XIII bacterium]|nr:polysaccharide deacetylase family protein [Clostridiales Family XIII bacterium]